MVVTTLFISGLILISTTVAGFLVSTQIRQATDTELSAQALFAADAGVEAALFCYRQEFKPCLDTNADNLDAFCGAPARNDKKFTDFGGTLSAQYHVSLKFSSSLDCASGQFPEGFVVRSEGAVGKRGNAIGHIRRVLESEFISY